jgi:CRISPR-associated protein Csm2
MSTKFDKIDDIQKVTVWITNGLDAEAIKYSELFGKELSPQGSGKDKDALTTSQIRNIYGEVQRLKMKGFDKTSLLLLKPRLAYTTERKGTEGSKNFRKIIDKALDAVLSGATEEEKKIRFENFANFFEAILAYHRSFGGK